MDLASVTRYGILAGRVSLAYLPIAPLPGQVEGNGAAEIVARIHYIRCAAATGDQPRWLSDALKRRITGPFRLCAPAGQRYAICNTSQAVLPASRRSEGRKEKTNGQPCES